MTEKRLGNMPRFYLRKIGLNYGLGKLLAVETQDKPSFGWDAQCRRVCSWAKLKDKVSGKEVLISSAFILTISVRWHVMSLL